MALDLMRVRGEMFVKGLTNLDLIKLGVDVDRMVDGGSVPCSQLTILSEVLDTDRDYLCGESSSPAGRLKWRTLLHQNNFDKERLRNRILSEGWSYRAFYSVISDRTNLNRIIDNNSNIHLTGIEIMNICFLLNASYEYLKGETDDETVGIRASTTATPFPNFIRLDGSKIRNMWKCKTTEDTVSPIYELTQFASEVGVSAHYLGWLLLGTNKKTSPFIANKIMSILQIKDINDIITSSEVSRNVSINNESDLVDTPIKSWNISMRRGHAHDDVKLYENDVQHQTTGKDAVSEATDLAQSMILTVSRMMKNDKMKDVIMTINELPDDKIDDVMDILRSSMKLLDK